MGKLKRRIETKNADSNALAFTKQNYVLLIIGILLILLGLILMAGDGSTETSFNPEIFSPLRIRLAPSICLSGYLFEVYAILK